MLQPDVAVSVIGLPSLNPLNEEKLARYLKKFVCVATVEEHCERGGIASIVSEVIARHGLGIKLIKCALPECCGAFGSQSDLRKNFGLDKETIAKKIQERMKNA